MVDCLKKRDAAVGVKKNEAAEVTKSVDVDLLGKSFAKFAGSDDSMDMKEFENFTKVLNLTRPQATALWGMLDHDGSGAVSKPEFTSALNRLQQARAWMRYCPDCIYDNTCAYCLETNANCTNCTENAFCSMCWADHPARHRDEDESANGGMSGGGQKAALSTGEFLRTQCVIRPLNWAYTSPMFAWLPVAQKAALRQALRSQQQAVADAVAKAQKEEEAALAAR